MSRSTTINLLLLAILVALVWLLAWPAFERGQELRAAVNQKETELAAEKETQEKLARLETELVSYQDVIERLETALPAERDVALSLAVFEEVANANGLVLTSVQLTEPKPRQGGVKILGAILKLEGRYGSLQNFLADVEATFPLMDVSDISFLVPLKPGSVEEEPLINPTLEVTVTLETYYR